MAEDSAMLAAVRSVWNYCSWPVENLPRSRGRILIFTCCRVCDVIIVTNVGCLALLGVRRGYRWRSRRVVLYYEENYKNPGEYGAPPTTAVIPATTPTLRKAVPPNAFDAEIPGYASQQIIGTHICKPRCQRLPNGSDPGTPGFRCIMTEIGSLLDRWRPMWQCLHSSVSKAFRSSTPRKDGARAILRNRK